MRDAQTPSNRAAGCRPIHADELDAGTGIASVDRALDRHSAPAPPRRVRRGASRSSGHGVHRPPGALAARVPSFLRMRRRACRRLRRAFASFTGRRCVRSCGGNELAWPDAARQDPRTLLRSAIGEIRRSPSRAAGPVERPESASRALPWRFCEVDQAAQLGGDDARRVGPTRIWLAPLSRAQHLVLVARLVGDREIGTPASDAVCRHRVNGWPKRA